MIYIQMMETPLQCIMFTNSFHIVMQAKSIHPVWFWSNHCASMRPFQHRLVESPPKRKEEKVKVKIREDLTYKTNFVFWIKEFVLTSNKLVLLERSEKASISTDQDAMKEKHIKKNSKSRSKKKGDSKFLNYTNVIKYNIYTQSHTHIHTRKIDKN